MVPLAESPLSVGSIFQGGYEILGELGTGSFGVVYKARQLSTSQEVAIKVLRLHPDGGVADVGIQTERFRREMQLCGELSHPNIVRLIDSGESDDGILYTVFEFVPGATLKAVLAREGKLGLRETVHLMGQVLDALSCAHAHGVVHRDLKPENIMVTKTGVRRNALVLDFGLGGLAREVRDWHLPRITATQEMMGTPCYAAPEQLRGEPTSTRSDLYSWGLIFLECLTGELVVGGASAHEVIMRQIGPEPIPIPPWIRRQRIGRLLETVTAKQIEKRDVTLEGLLQALSISELGDTLDRDAAGTVSPLPPGERRQLTVVCCRLTVVGVDGTAADLEDLDALVHAQHAMFAELAGRGGGQLASVMGDRVLLAFGYPQAHEDDARRASRTALQMAAEVERVSARVRAERQLNIEARFGIHTGLVIARELRQSSRFGLDELVGHTPQIAAALTELAGAGEVLVSGETHRLLRGELGSEPAAAVTLTDLPGELPAFRLVPHVAPASGATASAERETPLVGRAKQRDELLALWSQAAAGTSGVVLIRGEPGLGKSRLVRELRRQVPVGSWVEGRCAAENQGTPLRPFAELLSSLDEPIESLLARHGFDLAETVPLFAGLLSHVIRGRYPPLPYSRERQKELTLNAVLSLLMKISEAQPRVLVLEDLHWADPTTLDLAGLLVQEVRGAPALEGQPGRLCVVFTARPEFDPPWPTEDMAIMQLARLDRGQVEEMITAGLTPERPLAAPVVDEIVRRADGIPLFVEEMTRVLADAETARSDDPLASAAAVVIPSTLRDLLTARLDGLPPRVKDTVQLAAVLGREFRYEVLKAVSRKDEAALREDLTDLTRNGLVFQRRSVRSESYAFKHALVRDTAYESMVRATRQDLHRLVATTLQQRFPDIEQHRPEIVAQHFEAGAQVEAAVEYWIRAGDRALKRATYIEATQQLEHGLSLLRTAPESAGRNRLETELLTTLGTVLFSTKGYSAEEVERTFTRAQELCDELGEDVPAKVLTGIMGVHFTRSDRAGSLALLPRFEALTRRNDPVSAITGHATLGMAAFFRGDFVLARDHLSLAKPYYGTDEFQQYARAWGYDGGLLIYAYLMSTLWYLGYPDQAETLRKEMVAHAQAADDPNSILIALSFSTTLTLRLGDAATTLDLATQVMMRSAQEKLYVWMAAAMLAQGGALLQQGDVETAIAQMRQGLDIYRSIGLSVSYGFYLTYLADAYAAAGKTGDGLAVVEEGLTLCRDHLARFPESELLRLKGDLLAIAGDANAAETALRAAMDVAHRDSAKSLELRAAISMHRLVQQGNADPAPLRDIYSCFTEGFDTRDLRDASTLLAKTGS